MIHKFVELELAAFVASAGIKILGFDDLKFEFQGVEYLIECKRPRNLQNLDTNIVKAKTQLQKKFTKECTRGIIGIAVEKIFDLDSVSFVCDSSSAVKERAFKIAQDLLKEVQYYDRHWVDLRIVGMLAIIRFIAIVNGQPVYHYTLALCRFPDPRYLQRAESDRLDNFISKLQSSFKS